MFTFIRKLFSRKKQVKKFSTTLTTAIDGSNVKSDLSPEVDVIVKRLRKNETIGNEELNKVLDYYFNIPNIKPGLYNVNKSLVDKMCFDIDRVTTIRNGEGDIINIFLNLKEVTFNNDIAITISAKDFHETFNHLNLQPTESKS